MRANNFGYLFIGAGGVSLLLSLIPAAFRNMDGLLVAVWTAVFLGAFGAVLLWIGSRR